MKKALITPTSPARTSWHDCLGLSAEVAAVVMGVAVHEAKAQLQAAARGVSSALRRAQRASVSEAHAAETVSNFKHSQFAFTTPGHPPMTQTYRLILNSRVAETYRCRGCQLPQALPDSGVEALCASCVQEFEEKRKEEREWSASERLRQQQIHRGETLPTAHAAYLTAS